MIHEQKSEAKKLILATLKALTSGTTFGFKHGH